MDIKDINDIQEIIDEVIGKMHNINIDFDINNIDIEQVKDISERIYSNTAMILYEGVVERNPVIVALREEGILDVSTLEFYGDYLTNLNKVKGVFGNVKGIVDALDATQHGFRKEIYENIVGLTELVETAYPFFVTTIKVADMEDQEFLKESYLKILNKFNNESTKIIKKLKKKSIDLGEHFLSAQISSKVAEQSFEKLMKNMSIDNLRPAKIEENNKTKTIEVGISPVEQERRFLVKKANDMYLELELDFIRDLKSQVALSTFDKYKNFMDVKYKKFKENFNMPLSDNASAKQAKTAILQIESLKDAISEISEQSYLIGM